MTLTGGNARLTAAASVIQDADLRVNGAGTLTVRATNRAIHMSSGATSRTDSGMLTYHAGAEVWPGQVCTCGSLVVTAQSGAIEAASLTGPNLIGTEGTLSAGTSIGSAAMPLQTQLGLHRFDGRGRHRTDQHAGVDH